MRELHKQQGAWRDELAAKGVLVGLPSFRGPTGLTVVRVVLLLTFWVCERCI